MVLLGPSRPQQASHRDTLAGLVLPRRWRRRLAAILQAVFEHGERANIRT